MTGDDYRQVPKGKKREGMSCQYGTIAPIVREAIAKRGVIEVAKFAREHGLSAQGVAAACKREAALGRAVNMWSTFFRPDLAEKIRMLVAREQRS